jgi:hypothetical protein
VTARYDAEAGWIALDVAVGGDGQTRILRANGDGSVGLWIAGAAGELVSSASFTAPGGMTPRRLAAATDGSSQILFTGVSGQAALWAMTSQGAYRQSFQFKATPPSEGTSSWDVVLEVAANDGSQFCIYTPGVGTAFETTYQVQRSGESVSFLHPDDPIDWDEFNATLSGGNFAASISYPSGGGMCTNYNETNSFSGSFSADGLHFTATETWLFTFGSGQSRAVTFLWSGTRQ